MRDQLRDFPISDDPCVAEIYSNKLVAASFDGSAVVVTFGVTRFVPESITASPQRKGGHQPVHVTARLALSPVAAVEFVSALNKLLRMLRPTNRGAKSH
jgi:hypothetical protein